MRAVSLDLFDRLTHWSRVTHICVGNLTIIGPDNGLAPGRRQAITWTNVGILLIGPLGANFSEILIEILTFSFKKMRFKVSSAKWRPFCHGLNVLMNLATDKFQYMHPACGVTFVCPLNTGRWIGTQTCEDRSEQCISFWWPLVWFRY